MMGFAANVKHSLLFFFYAQIWRFENSEHEDLTRNVGENQFYGRVLKDR